VTRFKLQLHYPKEAPAALSKGIGLLFTVKETGLNTVSKTRKIPIPVKNVFILHTSCSNPFNIIWSK